MRKTIFSIIIALLAFLCAGCGGDQYAIEKQYYQLTKEAGNILKNPHSSPKNEVNRVVLKLNNFSRKFPGNNLSINAEFNIAQIYTAKTEYANARAQLNKIISVYNKLPAVCAQAAFLIANTYEMENAWASALAQYNKIPLEYPLTQSGINTPIYLTAHYKKTFEPDKMREAARGAIKHYNGLAEKYPDSPLEIRVQTLAADCYLLLQEPQSAIDTLNRLIEKYKHKINTDAIVMSIAVIYSREMKDKANTKLTLERLIKDYPKSKLVKQAKEILKKLQTGG